jgi:5-methylcytosine-specific restriction endonuclease McrA
MKPLFDISKLNDFKNGQKLPFECEYCSKTFFKTVGRIKVRIKDKKEIRFCNNSCKQRFSIIDYSNQKCHKLTFIKCVGTRNKGRSKIWEALCECGNTTIVVPSAVFADKIKSCGCLAPEGNSKGGIAKRQFDPKISSARAVWTSRYRELDFDIFYNLSQLNCHYCGRPPYRTMNRVHTGETGSFSQNQIENGFFTYNGLDRVDNSKKHTPDNVVPCCKECNTAKSNMSYYDFRNHIERIYNNFIKQSGITKIVISSILMPYTLSLPAPEVSNDIVIKVKF